MTNLNTENITHSLNALNTKLLYTENLVQMSKFIIEKYQNEMPADAANWLYGNMNLIEDLSLFDEMEQITTQLTDHMNNNNAFASSRLGLGEEIEIDDNDLSF